MSDFPLTFISSTLDIVSTVFINPDIIIIIIIIIIIMMMMMMMMLIIIIITRVIGEHKITVLTE